MTRDFQINGPTMVRVKFGLHLKAGTSLMSGTSPVSGLGASVFELGLASEGIRVTYQNFHAGVKADDFGPEASPDMMMDLGTADVRMSLVHYDPNVLNACWSESQGGSLLAGTFIGAGSLLGNAMPPFSSGNHLVSLGLFSLGPTLNFLSGTVQRFPTSYLVDRPVEFTRGTKRTTAIVSWRAFPYAYPKTGAFGPELYVYSSGTVLWDNVIDT